MADKILSVEELKEAQAAAQAQGTTITNYDQWEQILEDFETAGIQSTGSFDGDVKLHAQVMEQVEKMLQEAQEVQKHQNAQPNNDDSLKVEDKTKQDHEQVVKSNVANATSSTIMADYMKYYHLLG